MSLCSYIFRFDWNMKCEQPIPNYKNTWGATVGWAVTMNSHLRPYVWHRILKSRWLWIHTNSTWNLRFNHIPSLHVPAEVKTLQVELCATSLPLVSLAWCDNHSEWQFLVQKQQQKAALVSQPCGVPTAFPWGQQAALAPKCWFAVWDASTSPPAARAARARAQTSSETCSPKSCQQEPVAQTLVLLPL